MANYLYYGHIYNRGVDRRNIFKFDRDRNRFMLTIRFTLFSKIAALSNVLRLREKKIINSMKQKNLQKLYGPSLVELLAFCFMPNHYHIVVRSESKKNIAKFAQRLGNSYTKYFNTKYKRKGRLFESKYQIVAVESDDQLLHLIRYVHTNPSNSSKLQLDAEQLKNYQWSSLPAYLRGKSKMCNIKFALKFFSSIDSFWDFTKSGIDCDDSKLSNKLLIEKTP